MSDMQIMVWVGFNAMVIALLLLDLFVFHRKAHEVHFKEAVTWSAVWVALGVAFTAVIYFYYNANYDPAAHAALAAGASDVSERLGTMSGKDASLKYITGYLIEKSLSVDNLFVFLLIFRYCAVPAAYQHRVLFWGIIGALVFRAIFIFAGIALIERFHWMIYIFGALLVITGIRMAFEQDKEIHPEKNPVLKLLKRFMPVTAVYHGQSLVVHDAGRWVATPLLVALVVVETTDIIFAVDSIPAILAITTDPFIVYTSNVFAILGLRALFFALAGFMNLFAYLHYGLAAVLVFVGGKMLLADVAGKVPIGISLGVIGSILVLSVVISLLLAPRKQPEQVMHETLRDDPPRNDETTR